VSCSHTHIALGGGGVDQHGWGVLPASATRSGQARHIPVGLRLYAGGRGLAVVVVVAG